MHWRSNKQPAITVSSAAAEIYAMAEAAKDTRLNAWKAEEMGYDRETPYDIHVDNTAGMIFQAKMNADSRLKGIFDLRWSWVRELQDSKQIRAVKVLTDNNLADILTKCMSRPTYEGLIEQQQQKAMAVAIAKTAAAA